MLNVAEINKRAKRHENDTQTRKLPRNAGIVNNVALIVFRWSKPRNRKIL